MKVHNYSLTVGSDTLQCSVWMVYDRSLCFTLSNVGWCCDLTRRQVLLSTYSVNVRISRRKPWSFLSQRLGNGWMSPVSFQREVAKTNVLEQKASNRHSNLTQVTFLLTAHSGEVKPVRKKHQGLIPSPMYCVVFVPVGLLLSIHRGSNWYKRQMWEWIILSVTTCQRGTHAHTLAHYFQSLPFPFPPRSQVRIPSRQLGLRTRCSRTPLPPLPAPLSVREDSPQREGEGNFLQVQETAVGPQLLCCPRAVVSLQLPALRILPVCCSGCWAGRLQAALAPTPTPLAAADVAGSGWETVCIPS